MIFLSLASQKQNIYLLREADQFSGKTEATTIMEKDDVSVELNYVSIDNLKICINEQISYLLNNNSKIFYQFDFTNDFIFICYFLGNDFLPHLPSIDIKTGGLDFLLDCYMDTFLFLNNSEKICSLVNLINNKVNINSCFFNMFVQRLSKNEDYYFYEKLPRYLDYISRKRCPSTDPYEIENWELENMVGVNFDHDPI